MWTLDSSEVDSRFNFTVQPVIYFVTNRTYDVHGISVQASLSSDISAPRQLQSCGQIYLNHNYCHKNRLTHIPATVRSACSDIFTREVSISCLDIYCRFRETVPAGSASAKATGGSEIIIDAVER